MLGTHHKLGRTLLAAALLASTSAVMAMDGMDEDTAEWRAELVAMLDSRDTDVFELDFKPLELDRIMIKDRTGTEQVFHYLVFRLRNRVSDNARYLVEHATAFNEVMAAITAEHESARFDTEGGPRLYIEDANNIQDERLATILEREDLKVRGRTVNITAIAYDENGTRFTLFDRVPGEGDHYLFNFEDYGTERYGSDREIVREAIEEKEGRRLRTVNEIREMELPPYNEEQLNDEGFHVGEVYGILIFHRLSVEGDLFTVEVQGMSNKLRIRTPEHDPNEVEDYVNTRILRRTYVASYRRPGDEYFLDLAEFTPHRSGWEWRPSFQRIRHRSSMAYSRYFLENIALEQESTDTDGKPLLRNKQVEEEYWNYDTDAREEIAVAIAEKKGIVAAKRSALEEFYASMIEENEIGEEALRQRLQDRLQELDQRDLALDERMQSLTDRLPKTQDLLKNK